MKIKHLLIGLLGLVITLSAGFFYQQSTFNVGGDGTIYQLQQWKNDGTYITQNVASTSIKLTGYESSGYCLVTNASGVVSTSTCGAGGGSNTVYLASSTGYTIGGVAFATGNGTLSTVATGTITDTVTGLSFTNQTRSILGGATVLGLDTGYSIPTTNSLLTASASTTGNLAFWSGNQTIGNVATGTLTTTATGTQLSATRALIGGPAIFSWSTGYDAVLAASTTQWKGFYDTPSSRITAGTGLSWSGNTLSATSSHSAVTLSGALDYITLVGQDIVRGAIDLASDITGVLGIANGGLGAAFTDPNADQVMFWDDSAAKITGIVSMVGAAISGTTLTINDVTCTDCLTSTEIADEYLFNTGDVGTGIYDFGGATSIEIVNDTAPVVDAVGEIAVDTTDNQLIFATSTDANAPGVHPTTMRMGAFMIASTSQPFTTGFVTGKSISFPTNRDGYKVTELYCTAIGGTSVVINFDNGSGNTSTLTCTTAGASLIGVGANSVVTAGATTTAIETGTVTGAVDYLKVSVYGTYIRE